MLIDPTLFLQVVATGAAALSALAALLIAYGNRMTRRAIEQGSRTLVQPRIFPYGSWRDARLEIGIGKHRLTQPQIDTPGVFVENLGLGPALKGVMYVIDSESNRIPVRPLNERYTFRRIPHGRRYHFPSWDSPELEQYVRGQKTIRIQVEYVDINGVPYRLPSDEEVVDLVLQDLP